ncbi:glycoside hydrolase family 2 TIM barrel-domain containing protein [Alteromonadaceae bacterium BrNp21-10]|nr:glycoside hydrolase family 2 TIM barrel-domain containing protein [Alteromonadaceae bacterium BrNp21-10]
MLKPTLKFIVTGLLFGLVAGCNGAPETPVVNANRVININKNWQFYKTDQDAQFDLVKMTAADKVALPHTPQIEPRVVNDQWQGLSWYQRTLSADKAWQGKKVYLRFEGAMNHAQVWLNDELLGEHLGGYLPFTFDISSALNFVGDNILRVRLDNRDNPIIGPKPLAILDFNTYGGLYRDVNVIIKEPLHISDEILANQPASGGIFVSYPQVSAEKSVVEVKTHIANDDAQAKQFTLHQTLLLGEQQVATAQSKPLSLDANSAKQFSQQLTVTNAQLWSPQAPNLYQLITQVRDGNRVVEQQQTQIGIREFTFNEKHELLINGEKTFLRGVNRHQEYPHVGYATSAQADYRDAVKIKSAGFDYVRLSHYPHSKAFMQAADELGLVLIDAILGWQYYLDDVAFEEQIIRTCRDLIRRDRNHASVLAWECSLNESAMPEEFVAKLHNVVREEDPNGFSAGWMHGYDMYLQARQHRQQHYDIPTQPYNVSEYGDWEYYAQNAGLAQDSWQDLKEEERTSRQLLNAGEKRLLQQARNLQEAHNDNLTYPAYADGYWVMFDYNRGYADDIESSGIMSLYRLPKYSYYFYQSQRDASEQSPAYDSGPMVHIASEWTAESSTNVRVFSNADEVELWLNDEIVSRNKPSNDKYSTHLPHPPFEFKVPEFVSGNLIAKAFIDGKQVAEHKVTTPSAATSLHLSIDESRVPVAAGVKDIVFVYAELLDAQGNSVPLNDVEVVLTTVGDIEVVNPGKIVTSQGKAAAVVRIGESLNKAKVSVTAPELGISSEALSF